MKGSEHQEVGTSQEVKKEDDTSITEQEHVPNPEIQEPYFKEMSGNLDAKVEKLKDCMAEKKKLEQEWGSLQQCLEMELASDEITGDVTLNTILIVESAKELVKLIDAKEEEIQALSQEVDAGFNVTFDCYADKAEFDDDDNADKSKEPVSGVTKEETAGPSSAENEASDDSDTSELVGSSGRKRSAMASEEMSGNLEKKKLKQELESLQQCLEMELPSDEITGDVTLNTILIVESAKELVRLIDAKEIQALSQEVDAGFNVTFDCYADKAESDDDDNADKSKEPVSGVTKEETAGPSSAENEASDDSDTLELVGWKCLERSDDQRNSSNVWPVWGTTICAAKCKWGAGLATDGCQFRAVQYRQPQHQIADAPAEDIFSECFANFSRNYPLTDLELAHRNQEMLQCDQYDVARRDANKIFSIGQDTCQRRYQNEQFYREIKNIPWDESREVHEIESECHILVGLAGLVMLGDRIIEDLNKTAKRKSYVYTIDECATYSSEYMKIEHKREDWPLPVNFDMRQFKCSLVFVTCEKGSSRIVHVNQNAEIKEIKEFLCEGQGQIFGNKVLAKHWSFGMGKRHLRFRLKESLQAAFFYKLSGGTFSVVTIDIEDSECTKIRASADFTTGNMPWSKHLEDVHPYNHTTVWGSWWDDGRWGYKCCRQTEKKCYCTGAKGLISAINLG